MPHTFDWDNLEDIAIGLTDKFPDIDPSPCALRTCTNGSLNSTVFPAIRQNPTKQNSKLFKWRGTKSGKIGNNPA